MDEEGYYIADIQLDSESSVEVPDIIQAVLDSEDLWMPSEDSYEYDGGLSWF
ncbi:MAG: hypothetical protein LUC50_08585 [Ruminococcus sp.]|nr:hypothetical protein [Ruminococcus sp.]